MLLRPARFGPKGHGTTTIWLPEKPEERFARAATRRSGSNRPRFRAPIYARFAAIASISRFNAGASDVAAFHTSRQSTEK